MGCGSPLVTATPQRTRVSGCQDSGNDHGGRYSIRSPVDARALPYFAMRWRSRAAGPWSEPKTPSSWRIVGIACNAVYGRCSPAMACARRRQRDVDHRLAYGHDLLARQPVLQHRGAAAMVMPVAAVCALRCACPASRCPTSPVVFRVHLLVSMLAYSLFTIASLHVLLMALLEPFNGGELRRVPHQLPPLLMTRAVSSLMPACAADADARHRHRIY